jgi:hypothetical protein
MQYQLLMMAAGAGCLAWCVKVWLIQLRPVTRLGLLKVSAAKGSPARMAAAFQDADV